MSGVYKELGLVSVYPYLRSVILSNSLFSFSSLPFSLSQETLGKSLHVSGLGFSVCKLVSLLSWSLILEKPMSFMTRIR